jgi:hypothetical protein
LVAEGVDRSSEEIAVEGLDEEVVGSVVLGAGGGGEGEAKECASERRDEVAAGHVLLLRFGVLYVSPGGV